MTGEYLIHIPHSSVTIPENCSFLIDPEAELNHMTDRFTDELFDLPAQTLIFPISRLVCDVERFRDDRMEEMARRGMGVCYTRTHDGKPLRCVTPQQREAILSCWYDPHHRRLSGLVSETLACFGRCTIWDCHSFSPVPLPYEPDQNPDRPDICIGTDRFHTPPELAAQITEAFRDRGYRVSVNTPYAGTIVPLEVLHRDPRVRSVMIEVNRGLYLDGTFGKNRGFSRLARDIRDVFQDTAEVNICF